MAVSEKNNFPTSRSTEKKIVWIFKMISIFHILALSLTCGDVKDVFRQAECCGSSASREISNCESEGETTASKFLLPFTQTREQWGETMQKNDNYQPNVPNSMLNWMSVHAYDVFKFSLFKHDIVAFTAFSEPVADLDFVYMLAETKPTDADTREFIGFDTSHGVFTPGIAFLLKVDRRTGEIVLEKDLFQILPDASQANLRFLNAAFAKPPQYQDGVMTRGPMSLVDDNLYIVYQLTGWCKVNKHDFTLVYDVDALGMALGQQSGLNGPDPGMFSKNDLAANKISAGTRSINVMKRNEETWVFISIAVFAYGFDTTGNLRRFQSHYVPVDTGMVIAFMDRGSYAETKWTFDSYPVTEQDKEGDLLSIKSFHLDENGDVNDVLKIYQPLIDGFAFTSNGDRNGYGMPHSIGCKRVIDNRVFVDPYSGHFDPSLIYKVAYIPFEDGDVFHVSDSYTAYTSSTCTGESVEIAGSFLDGQPIVKELYTSMAGKYVLSSADAYNLMHCGASHYGFGLYDEQTDSVYFGSGNNQYEPYADSLAFTQAALNDENEEVEFTNSKVLLQSIADELHLDREELLSKPINFIRDTIGTNTTLQLNIWRQYHERWDRFHDLNFGPRSNRHLYGTMINLDIETGKLNFALKNGWDYMDHNVAIGRSTTRDYESCFVVENERVVNTTSDYRCGNAQPSKALRFTPFGQNPSYSTGGTIMTIDGHRYLVTVTKYRLIVWDLEVLTQQRTLMHVDGETDESDPQYDRGIKENNAWKHALVFASSTVAWAHQHVFGNLACDPKTSICVIKTTNLRFIDGSGKSKVENTLTCPAHVTSEKECASDFLSILFAYDIKSIVQKTYGPQEYMWSYVSNDINDRYPYTNLVYATRQAEYGSGMNENTPISDLMSYTDSLTPYMQTFSQDNLGIIMYGEFVITGSTDGELQFINTVTGKKMHSVRVPGGTMTQPIVLDGIVYGITGATKYAYMMQTSEDHPLLQSTVQDFYGRGIYMLTPFGK